MHSTCKGCGCNVWRYKVIVNTSTCIAQMGAITVEGGPLTHSMGLSQVNFDFKLIFFKLVG